MQFRSKLTLDVFVAQSINKGKTVLYIKDGKPLETKISHVGDGIMVTIGHSFLSYAFSPVTFWLHHERGLLYVEGLKETYEESGPQELD